MQSSSPRPLRRLRPSRPSPIRKSPSLSRSSPTKPIPRIKIPGRPSQTKPIPRTTIPRRPRPIRTSLKKDRVYDNRVQK